MNVGSGPFLAFVRALTARCPDATARGLREVWDVVRFLREYAADWRAWLSAPPSFLVPYEEELRRQYLAPLARHEPARAPLAAG